MSFYWEKIQAYIQKPDTPVHEYYNWHQIIFRENFGLPLDTDFSQVAYNSVY